MSSRRRRPAGRPLTAYVDFLVDAQHVRSERPLRALADEAANPAQNVLQSAIRLHL